MAKTKEDRKIGCGSCKFAGTHAKCGGCLSTNQAKADAGLVYPYYYKNHVFEEYPGQAMDLLRKEEESGERNIVIGGTGEAEINTKWTFEEAVKSLCHVAEECGYLVQTYGEKSLFEKGIDVHTDMGHFQLVYYNEKHASDTFGKQVWRIVHIKQIVTKTLRTFK